MTNKHNEIENTLALLFNSLEAKHKELADAFAQAALALNSAEKDLQPELALDMEPELEPDPIPVSVSVEGVASLCVAYSQGDKVKSAEIRAKLSEFGATRLSQLTNNKLVAMEDWIKEKVGE